MPIPKLLPVLQQELRDQLTEDLAGALKALQQLLPPGSEKYDTVTTLLGKLNDTNKARLRGTIANDDLQLAYNQLRSDLLDLIDALEVADFEASQAVPAVKKAKQGEILYRIPHTMPLGAETRCLVRIALDAEAIVENITLDEHVSLKQLSRVSDLMQVELVDPAGEPTFQIRSINSPEQLVEDEGYTEWLFQVKPLREGNHPLMIKVSVIELLMGKERKKEIVLEEIIEISAEVKAAPDAPLKSAGEALVFVPPPEEQEIFTMEPPLESTKSPAAPKPSSIYVPPPMRSVEYTPPGAPPVTAPPQVARKSANKSKPLRAAALFLAFIVFSAGATWAVAPDEAAWVWARYVQDTPQAYAEYAQSYPKSRHRETALFRRAAHTNAVADLQLYRTEYPNGRHLNRVNAVLDTLERRDFEVLRRNPEATKVQEYIQKYPNSTRLEAVQRLVDTASRNLPREQLPLELKKKIELQPVEAPGIEGRKERLKDRRSSKPNRQ